MSNRKKIKLPADAGYEAWITEDLGHAVKVDIVVDGIEEPYMTEEARRMHERALHPKILRGRLADGRAVAVEVNRVSPAVRAHHQKLLDEAPETRPRLFHRVVVDLPAGNAARLAQIRRELDWFVATRRAQIEGDADGR